MTKEDNGEGRREVRVVSELPKKLEKRVIYIVKRRVVEGAEEMIDLHSTEFFRFGNLRDSSRPSRPVKTENNLVADDHGTYRIPFQDMFDALNDYNAGLQVRWAPTS